MTIMTPPLDRCATSTHRNLEMDVTLRRVGDGSDKYSEEIEQRGRQSYTSLLRQGVLSIMMKRSFLVCWSTIAGGSYKRTYSICMYSFLAVTAIYRFFSFFRAAGRVLLGHSDAKILYARTSLMSAMNFPAFWKDGTTPGVVQIPLDKLPRLLPASESDGFLFLPVPPKIKPPICHRFQGRKKALSTPWSRCRPPRKNPATAYVCAYLSRFPSVSAWCVGLSLRNSVNCMANDKKRFHSGSLA